jgi:LysR family transcriptional regulator, hca operon transcriptional activator
MELRHLRYFVAVAEALNFTRAAQRLHTAQPSLSQQIKQLESEVGAPLFERDRQRVQLTPAGRAFYAEAKAVLDRITYASRLAAKVAGGDAGELSIGTFAAADVKILPRLRTLLAERLPDLRLVFHSRYAVEPYAGLRQGTIDVAFMRSPLTDPELSAIELLREPLVVVMPAGHALARRRRVPIRALDRQSYVVSRRELAPQVHDAVLNLIDTHGLRMQAVSGADNVHSQLHLVQSGLGLGILPDYVSAILPPGIVARPIDGENIPTLGVCLAQRRDARLPTIASFTTAVRECCRLR